VKNKKNLFKKLENVFEIKFIKKIIKKKRKNLKNGFTYTRGQLL
jgi:hypothetical protein